MPLTPDQELVEHEWKVKLMQSDIRLKDEQTRWEPWKAIAAATTAAVLLAGGIFSAGLWLGSHFLSH